jgi:HEPN domain-containing protein
MNKPESEAPRWLRQAEYDFQFARYSADGGYYAAACFQAQQATEKALKAYLFGKGHRFAHGHSVSELAARCAEHDETFAVLRKGLAVLDRFYIPTRYPNGLPGGIPAEVFFAEDAEQALALAEEALSFVRQRLKLEEEE